MTEPELFETVRRTIATMFNRPPDTILRETVAEDVDGWDSLRHTILMVRLGKAVGTPLPEDVAEAASVGDLADRIAALLRG